MSDVANNRVRRWRVRWTVPAFQSTGLSDRMRDAVHARFVTWWTDRNSSNSTTSTPVKIMGRLGLFYVTALMTFLSALLSAFVAWLFSFIIDVPNYGVHIFLAFVIPFFVTPTFSYLSALSMRDLQRARKKAVDLARIDMLTGLGNRRAFFDTARRLADAKGGTRAVLYIDIDHFKSINDQHGHEAGDAVLKHFATLMRACTRMEDFVARIGGEEFAVIVEDTEPAGVAAIAYGLIARVRGEVVTFAGKAIRYTVSIGGATGGAELALDKLLLAADQQLYAVKGDGRNGYRGVDLRAVGADQPADIAVRSHEKVRRTG